MSNRFIKVFWTKPADSAGTDAPNAQVAAPEAQVKQPTAEEFKVTFLSCRFNVPCAESVKMPDCQAIFLGLSQFMQKRVLFAAIVFFESSLAILIGLLVLPLLSLIVRVV